MQILAAAREPLIAEDSLELWQYGLSATFILISAACFLWAQSGKLPISLSYPLAAIGYIMAGIKPISFMYAEQISEPFYMAVVMLAGSLCFLSTRYLMYCMLAIALAWLSVAMLVLPLNTSLPGLGVMLLGAALSLFVQNRRIFAAIEVFALRQRLQALESILPMCANCKKTRDENGQWKTVEEYIEESLSGTQVSHGSCPACTQELYGDLLKNR